MPTTTERNDSRPKAHWLMPRAKANLTADDPDHPSKTLRTLRKAPAPRFVTEIWWSGHACCRWCVSDGDQVVAHGIASTRSEAQEQARQFKREHRAAI